MHEDLAESRFAGKREEAFVEWRRTPAWLNQRVPFLPRPFRRESSGSATNRSHESAKRIDIPLRPTEVDCLKTHHGIARIHCA
jgi:hypothetical protein